jgi:hypothetical protein
LVARLLWEQEVVGSNPATPTMNNEYVYAYEVWGEVLDDYDITWGRNVVNGNYIGQYVRSGATLMTGVEVWSPIGVMKPCPHNWTWV